VTSGRRGSRFTFGRVAVALTVFAGMALSACTDHAPQDALKPKGPIARTEDHLFKPVFWIAVAVFILVEGLIVYSVIRFRRRGDDDAPVQVHGNSTLELGWTIAPAVLLLVIGFFTIKTVFEVNRIPKGPNVVHVTVIGHRWWWEYRYPDLRITTANELHIPIGRPVALTLESDDVIHSFWPPALAGKVDVVPGRKNHMTIQADLPDTYFGQCAEYCGTSHANMRLRVVAMTGNNFDTWVSQQQAGPALISSSTAASNSATPAEAGAALFLSKGCSGCHTVNGVSVGSVGPNLTHLQSRTTFAGATFDLNDRNLREWLRDPPAMKPGSVMPNLNLSEEEITQLIAYLDTLK
jgi:cytochrome c oxidase subunit 2